MKEIISFSFKVVLLLIIILNIGNIIHAQVTAGMLKQLPDKLHSKTVGYYNIFELNNRNYA